MILLIIGILSTVWRREERNHLKTDLFCIWGSFVLHGWTWLVIENWRCNIDCACSVYVQFMFVSQHMVFCLCSVWVYQPTCGVLSVFSLSLPVNLWCSVCVQFEFTSQLVVFCLCSVWVYQSTCGVCLCSVWVCQSALVFCQCLVWVYQSRCGVLSVFSLSLPINLWCSVCVQFEFTSQLVVFCLCSACVC